MKNPPVSLSEARKMRDPRRIYRILAKLELIWDHYPDWRLTQLIENAAYRHSETDAHCIYYVEDDVTEKGLDRLIERLGK